MRFYMKYCIQTLFSIISSVSVMIVFYLLSIFVIKEIKQDIWQILLYIGIVVLTLILNFVFGYYFSDKLLKGGFIIQLVILLLISVVIICYENTFVFYIGIFVNPIYTYSKEILWHFDAMLSNALFIKSIIAMLSSILPGLFMFLGSLITKQKK